MNQATGLEANGAILVDHDNVSLKKTKRTQIRGGHNRENGGEITSAGTDRLS